MAILLTQSGKYVDVTNLNQDDIDIVDIAHSLSNLSRYNGHTARFYSVAEHCVRLARYAVNNFDRTNDFHLKLAKALLLHDASECYVGDVIYNLKKKLTSFIELEDKIIDVVNLKFDIDTSEEIQKNVKSLDRRICFDEMYVLMPEVDNVLFKEQIKPLGVEKLRIGNNDYFGWQPELAKERFLAVATWLGLYEPPKQDIVEQPELPHTDRLIYAKNSEELKRVDTGLNNTSTIQKEENND